MYFGIDFMKVKSKYGDIMEVKTTGASKETADADGYSGVTASERMAEYDKDDTNTYIDIIRKVGKENEIAPALICGIISRETRGGRAIRKPSPPITSFLNLPRSSSLKVQLLLTIINH
uniref:Lysozyme g n=1 Tax=Oncorhynchus mykiss TaxID=8022 RepID=A0A8C7T0P9_ONCMY